MKNKFLTLALATAIILNPVYAFSQEKMTLNQYIAQADKGNPYAAFRTGLAYEYGVGGLKKDSIKAINYYKISDQNGNIKATAKLGGLYLTQGYQKDALPYLIKASKAGDSLAQAYMGKLLENNRKNDNAVNMYELSSKAKNPMGQLFYSDYLIKNFSKNKNSNEFLKGYALLALSAQKNDDAQKKLAQSRENFSVSQKQLIAKYILQYK